MDKVITCAFFFLLGFLLSVFLIETTDETILKIKSEKALCEKEIKRYEKCEIESFNFKIVNKD